MTPPGSPENDGPPLYEVRLTEPAEIEIDAEYERLAQLVSEAYADRWRDGLLAEMQRLALFPSGHEVARENDLYDVEVRRMLYHGPSRRRKRGGVVYRVLFYIIEPTGEEETGLVRVLHVWHGARQPPV